MTEKPLVTIGEIAQFLRISKRKAIQIIKDYKAELLDGNKLINPISNKELIKIFGKPKKNTWSQILHRRKERKYKMNEVTIYFIQAKNGLIKIGFTEDLKQRLSQLKSASPSELKVIKEVQAPRHIEEVLHNYFSQYKHHGEWYVPAPAIMRLIEDGQVP